MYTVKSMKKWQDTGSYAGDDLSHWYILVSRTRDSNCLENSNYESILRDIKAKGFTAAESSDSIGGYLECSFGHWACGWIEAIMIHEDSSDSLLEWSDQVKAALDDYPVYDEEDLSERELDIQYDYIKDYIIREYVNSQDYDLDDNQIEEIASTLLREFEWEVNGYDEVSYYNCSQSDIESFIDRLVEAQKNMRHCNTCGADYDSVTSACKCQIRMNL